MSPDRAQRRGIPKTIANLPHRRVAGGIVVLMEWSTIKHCTNNGAVSLIGTSPETYMGGIVGYAHADAILNAMSLLV